MNLVSNHPFIRPNPMIPMSLPKFKYHPEPLKTGLIEKSENECECCEKERGYIYTGPVYAEEELVDAVCPWCISDGSAHEKFNASFTDECGIGGGGLWDEVPESVIEEVAQRTPGFSGWQQEQWWTHCGDAAAFVGRVGRDELQKLGPDAIEAIRDATALEEGPEWDQFLAALNADGSPSAYLFQCLHCAKYGGYTDCD